MHLTGISRRRAVAASALALTLMLPGCSCDDCNGVTVQLQRTALLALARADSAAPAPSSMVVQVKNNETRTVRITHTDSAQTLFLEFTFPAGTLLQAGGRSVCDTCTIPVSIQSTNGVYGFRVGPSDIAFRSSATPTVTVHYSRYGNFGVRDSSTLYPTDEAFELALRLWYQGTEAPDFPSQTPDEVWRVSRNSAHIGAGMVGGAIDAPGLHLLAARK
jgi:hypothetical protein